MIFFSDIIEVTTLIIAIIWLTLKRLFNLIIRVKNYPGFAKAPLVISIQSMYFRVKVLSGAPARQSLIEMRRNLILSLGLFLWLLFALGCDNTKEVIVNPPIVTINSAIKLTSFENLDPVAPTFELRCLTDSLYDCTNYQIEFLLDTNADTFDLIFTEIDRPGVCLPGNGRAFAIINLGDLAGGTYQFPVTVNNVVASADLVVTDSTIEVIGGDSTWTNFLRPILRRIPSNTIWGQVGYNLIAALDSANTFFDSLVSIGAVAETLSTGSYGYFYFNGSGNPDSILELGPSIGTNFRIPYVYTFSGDTATLHSLITAYANQGNVVEVNVITSEGYEYRSW